MSAVLESILGTEARKRVARVPDLSDLPDNALLTDKQKSLHSGFSVEAFKKWRREGRGPETIYIEGRPRSTVAAYRAWLATAQRA
ncbi:hypothetical protein [Aureimonas phyllosphaerae]|uniref:Uncharacterized protein n=1 Tax=Aureimonas phyllosphaerae TaxID=1166078 RepID=A0A7W6BXE4_9HYPH|nr:hypothetical protein [Aureimonas phyllosphaerae]MBB3938165.1 hypothetical protein [Aureimonas phyllosphaerae]MBB3962173.1 hypothetical protein [Aureimonas phyllosphaerae]SFF56550.1 hypothetical protein SAMN05216566_1307 [Aureimonas phyllosphaerae]